MSSRAWYAAQTRLYGHAVLKLRQQAFAHRDQLVFVVADGRCEGLRVDSVRAGIDIAVWRQEEEQMLVEVCGCNDNVCFVQPPEDQPVN